MSYGCMIARFRPKRHVHGKGYVLHTFDDGPFRLNPFGLWQEAMYLRQSSGWWQRVDQL